MIQLIRKCDIKKYHLDRNDILLTTNLSLEIELSEDKTDNETALDIYPNSLFNKKVSLSDNSFVGFMMEMTDSKIIVFGDYEQRYDIPKIKTAEVNNNIVLAMEWNEFASYRVDCD